jgi:hypothetical protein
MLGGITDTVADLSERVTIYAEFLPKQARWQAELLIHETLQDVDFEQVVETTRSLADTLERITTTVESTPELISRERQATTDALEEITRLLIASSNRQRLDTIDELRVERVAVLAALQKERQAVVEALRVERAATMVELGELLDHSVERSFDRADRLMDGIFWRALVLLALGAVAVLLIGVIVARNIRVRTT